MQGILIDTEYCILSIESSHILASLHVLSVTFNYYLAQEVYNNFARQKEQCRGDLSNQSRLLSVLNLFTTGSPNSRVKIELFTTSSDSNHYR